ncbi:hypothetical protein [Acinetobacter calcoaceticus]|uniref:hypothetical protein n=1 Tax=Acinetobacter calcoaceticus TaxID=471 RepID=UPI0002CEB2C7|nr:hypothetical protein [Acinetobacter calcoaceticus]ENU08655.1 hypothetical protein F997_02102 [Acinetobacter calcoaceticus NIPH 13]
MVKKTLEHKIKDLIFCTFAFLILYLIIGFMLQTEWLDKRLDLKRTYELLKDGLTITASFLAPVAAFVLFSDWREQHVSINNEKVSKEILNILDEFYVFYSLSFAHLLEKDEFFKKQDLFYQKLNNLSDKKAEINAKDAVSEDFLFKVQEIQKLLPNFWWHFTDEVRAYQEFQKFKDIETALAKSVTESSNKKHFESQDKKIDVFKEIVKKRNKLSILYV